MYHFYHILFTLLMSRLLVVGSTSLCRENIPYMSFSNHTIMVIKTLFYWGYWRASCARFHL